jgi:hypothetical protein
MFLVPEKREMNSRFFFGLQVEILLHFPTDAQCMLTLIFFFCDYENNQQDACT